MNCSTGNTVFSGHGAVDRGQESRFKTRGTKRYSTDLVMFCGIERFSFHTSAFHLYRTYVYIEFLIHCFFLNVHIADIPKDTIMRSLSHWRSMFECRWFKFYIAYAVSRSIWEADTDLDISLKIFLLHYQNCIDYNPDPNWRFLTVKCYMRTTNIQISSRYFTLLLKQFINRQLNAHVFKYVKATLR